MPEITRAAESELRLIDDLLAHQGFVIDSAVRHHLTSAVALLAAREREHAGEVGRLTQRIAALEEDNARRVGALAQENDRLHRVIAGLERRSVDSARAAGLTGPDLEP